MTDFARHRLPDYDPPRARYSVKPRWLHWLTALLMFAVIPIGWIFAAFKTKPGAPDTFVAPFPGAPTNYASAHMTVGLTILAVVAGRILYRTLNRPPPFPRRTATLEKALANVTHWLLYGVLLIMPISGYIMSSGDKTAIWFLGLVDVPKLPIDHAQNHIAAAIHVYVQFAVYGLIVLHIAGVAWHLFVRRDDFLGRVLPVQSNVD